jgi:hypothetical protein
MRSAKEASLESLNDIKFAVKIIIRFATRSSQKAEKLVGQKLLVGLLNSLCVEAEKWNITAGKVMRDANES